MPAVTLDFDTDALRATALNFYAFDAEVQDAARLLVETAGDAMLAIAQSISPVDTGFMRDHIQVRISPKGYAVSVGWDAQDFEEAGLDFYPPYVELGTSRQAAQPTIWPAYDQVAPQFELDLAALISTAAQRASAA